jgi:hypothetical protein
MPFVVYVAADLYSQKINLEVETPGVPTVSELLAQVQAVFNAEALALKPPTMMLQTVRVSKLQIYKDEDGSWADLTSPTQLSEFAQLYIFQAEPQYQESQQPIPPARRPSRPAAAAIAAPARTPIRPRDASPPRASYVAPHAQTTTTPYSAHRSAARADLSAYNAASASRSLALNESALHQLRQVSPRRDHSVHPSIVPHVSLSGLTAAAAGTANHTATGYNGPSSPQREHLARAQVPDHPSQRDKIGYLFDEMDANGNRVIEPEEFRSLIRALGVDFNNATLTDLLHRGDLDRDGVLSLGEFTQLFTAYPTLLDALFFRLRDIQEARNLQAQMVEERRALDDAREQRARAASMLAECSRLVAETHVKVRETEGELACASGRENEVHHAFSRATADAEQSARLRVAAQSDVDSTRDKETSHRGAVAAAERDVRDGEATLAVEHERLLECQDKERQLQQLLLEAQKATERQHRVALEVQSDLARRRDIEHGATQHLAEVQRELQILGDRLNAAERDLRVRDERQKDVHATLAEATAVVARLQRALDDHHHDAVVCADREKSNRLLLNESESNVIAAERRVAARDQDILTFNQRRASMEQQERPLLEQEVRLREARDSLDEREVKLRRDAVTYFDSSRISGNFNGSTTHGGSGVFNSTKTLSPPRAH